MQVLGFDACLGAVSAAVARSGSGTSRILAHRFEPRATGHAERLLPMIADVLAEAGLAFTSLQRLATTLGPGTFTGVRTTIAAARALRLATSLEVVAMTSLSVLAAEIDAGTGPRAPGRGLLVAVDARRDRFYVQAFGATALDPLGEPREVTLDEAADWPTAGTLALAGSGAPAIADAATRRHRQVEIVREAFEPDARYLAELAPRLSPLATVSPVYLRAPDAKPQAASTLRSPT